MGEQSDDLARVAFSGEVFTTTFNLFPDKELFNLSKATERHNRYTKERMEDLLSRLEDKRDDANHLDTVKIQKDNDK